MTDEFMLHLTFTDFKNLVTKAGVENEDHWFSYKLLDDVYHSDTFLGSQSGPTPYTEMIKLNIPKVVGNGEVWSKELLDRFVLHVFLVANKVIVSTTQINLFSSVVSNALPIKSKTTATLLSIDELADAGHLTVIAEIRNSANELEYIQKPLNSPIPRSPAKPVPPQADEYDDDEFEDQEGEKSPHKEVHFPENLPEDDEGQRQLDYLRSEDNTDSEKRRREKEMAENCLRKFQITIAVKGVGGLSRAANTLTTHIIDYPFLNPNLPLTYHTHHVKVDARSEVQIPGDKCASYDCCMSRRELREILIKHPVPILVKNKTIGIGSEDLGVVLVDLRSVLETTPKFQSPLAKNSQQKLPRNFSTIEDYLYYREKMCDRDIYLPEDPVYVHSVETRHIPFSKPDPVTRAYEPNGYLRVVVVIKDLCRVEGKIGVPVKQGYRMHNGGVYENDGEDDHFEVQEQQQEQHRPKEIDVNSALSEVERILAKGRQEIQRERDEWATFQREEEFKWKELLKQKEVLLRQHIQEECNRELARKADDLRRAQEECGKIEIKLKAELARVEQLSHQAVLDAAHHKQMYEQKVITVDLIARKARQEANESKLKDQARADASEQRVKELEEKLKTARDDLYKADKRYDDYRAQQRGTPETKLREENAELRAVLSERTAEIERQKKLVAQEKLQTEHYRAQVHSLALALKKERAKSSDVARMELEQLRLEFLAREERYILDGDREELRNIRNELSALKSFTLQSNNEERNKGGDSSQQQHSHSQHPNQSSHQQSTSYNQSRSPSGTSPGTSSPYMPREYQIREYQPASREHLMQQRDLTDLRASAASQPSDETKTMTPERATVRSVEKVSERVYTQSTTTNSGSGDSNNSVNKATLNIAMPSSGSFVASNSARQKELDNLVKALQRMQTAGVYHEDDAAVVQVKAKIAELTGGGGSVVEY